MVGIKTQYDCKIFCFYCKSYLEYIDNVGNLIYPEKENAYKYETFIFDIFSYVDDVGLLKGIREEIFAPIKNMDGVDSPETAESYIKRRNIKISSF